MIQTSPTPQTQIRTQAATSSSPTTSTQFRGPGQQQEYSCVLCKQRKVRCDRANPCTGCVKAGVNCVPGSRQPYKRRKRVHSQSGSLNETDFSAKSRDIHSSPSRSLDSRPAQEELRPQRQAPTFGQYVRLLSAALWQCIYTIVYLGPQTLQFSDIPTGVSGPG